MSWPEVKYALNSTLGTEEFIALDEIIKNTINTYSPIRHIQRGTATIYDGEQSITLNGFANLEKMVVLLNGGGTREEGYTSYIVSSLPTFTLSVNKLSISCETDSSYADPIISYQVIEFM